MIRQSHISTYKNCPYKYYIQYIKQLEVLPNQDAQEARRVGTMFHLAIEKGLEVAIDWYYKQFYVISDLQIHEVMKLEALYPKVMKIVNSLEGEFKHELRWEYEEYMGTVDLYISNNIIIGNDCILDFKYSNNIENYLKSPQLHIYKYFMNKLGYQVDKLGFIFIPKTQIRQKKTEDLFQFRKRLIETLDSLEPQLIYVDYDESLVQEAFKTAEIMQKDTEFIKCPSRLCDWCDYNFYCESEGKDE